MVHAKTQSLAWCYLLNTVGTQYTQPGRALTADEREVRAKAKAWTCNHTVLGEFLHLHVVSSVGYPTPVPRTLPEEGKVRPGMEGPLRGWHLCCLLPPSKSLFILAGTVRFRHMLLPHPRTFQPRRERLARDVHLPL